MVRLEAEGQLERLLKVHEDEQASTVGTGADEEGDEPQQYPFYTEGSNELLEARIDIAKFSIARAKARIERSKRRRDDPDEDEDAEAKFVVEQAGNLFLNAVRLEMNGRSPDVHFPEMAQCLPRDNHIATASADRTAKLWSSDGVLLRSFDGHLDCLGRIAFHPSGKYLGTASFDKTWRLWDINTGVELLLQEGHSRSVYAVCFHPDGSLAASCGLDALARVWDLRTGRSILAFEGHVKTVLGLSFSPNGYHLATGSEDNTCRIWDLRKRRTLYTIPAHTHLISQVWSGQDFKPVKSLVGHEDKVTGLDISGVL